MKLPTINYSKSPMSINLKKELSKDIFTKFLPKNKNILSSIFKEPGDN